MIIKKDGEIIAENACLCKGFMKFWGLRFTKNFKKHDALLFKGENSIIDMFFVFHKILVLWLDKEKKVVDKRTAHPFNVYVPKKKSRYIVELPLSMKENINLGDILDFNT